MLDTIRNGVPTIRRLRDEMDHLFGNVLEGRWVPDFGALVGGTFPAMNVWETESALFVEAEVPGLALSEVDVQVVGDELTLRGERKDTPLKDSVYHRRERPASRFSRTVRLPTTIDAEKVEAALRDGVLTVTLPKAEAAKPRKIVIHGV